MTCGTKEVQNLLSRLNANKSCGVDKIPARLLKETADAYLNYGNWQISHLYIRMVIESQWKIIEASHS